MKKRILRLAAMIVGMGLVLGLGGCCSLVQSCLHQVLIITQPESQTVLTNRDATFSVYALGGPPFTTNGLTYQWQFNGSQLVATNIDLYFSNIVGATNSSVTITGVQTSSNYVGYYRVVVSSGSSTVTSAPAALQVYLPSGSITVYGTPIASNGSATCPPSYIGYINYKNSPHWGWGVTNMSLAASGTDGVPTSGSYVQMLGPYDEDCAATSASISPPKSTRYEFTIYFTALPVPTGSYPLVLKNLQ